MIGDSNPKKRKANTILSDDAECNPKRQKTDHSEENEPITNNDIEKKEENNTLNHIEVGLTNDLGGNSKEDVTHLDSGRPHIFKDIFQSPVRSIHKAPRNFNTPPKSVDDQLSSPTSSKKQSPNTPVNGEKKQAKINVLKGLLKAMIMLKRLYPTATNPQIARLETLANEIIRQRPFYKLKTLLHDLQILEKLKIINVAQIVEPETESKRLSVIHVDLIAKTLPISYDDEIPTELESTVLYQAVNNPLAKKELQRENTLQSPKKDLIAQIDQRNFKIFRHYKEMEEICLHCYLAFQSISQVRTQIATRLPLPDLLNLIASGHEERPKQQKILKGVLDLANEAPTFISLYYQNLDGSVHKVDGTVYLREEASLSSLLQRPISDLHIELKSSSVPSDPNDTEKKNSDFTERIIDGEVSNSPSIKDKATMQVDGTKKPLVLRPPDLVVEVAPKQFNAVQQRIRELKEEHRIKSHL